MESRYIEAGSYDSSIRIWDIKTMEIKYSLRHILCLLEFRKNELIVGNSLNCIDIVDLMMKEKIQ